jgi:hypothetical protein
MNINAAEKSLAHYHLLHFAIGLGFAAILLALPKIVGVAICVFLLSLFLPAAILPEFTRSMWLDRVAVLAGAIAVGVLSHFLHKL